VPGGIELLLLDNGFNEFFVGPFVHAYACAWMKRAGDTFGSAELGGGSRGSKVSERLLSGVRGLIGEKRPKAHSFAGERRTCGVIEAELDYAFAPSVLV